MTDPIADMLTRLRNANTAYHDSVGMPYSKIKAHIAEILKQEGYISDFAVADGQGVAANGTLGGDPATAGAAKPSGSPVGKSLMLTLKYGPTRERSIAGLRRVSKPGLRVYAKANNMPRVLNGLGVAIISTSHGLLTDRAASKQGVGGEVLAYVW
jgi:small subunit ribosomal protein S8